MEVLQRQSDLRTDKQDKKVIATSMKQTFSDRREFIVTGNAKIAEIKEKYPLLFNDSEVSTIQFSIHLSPICRSWFFKPIENSYSSVPNKHPPPRIVFSVGALNPRLLNFLTKSNKIGMSTETLMIK